MAETNSTKSADYQLRAQCESQKTLMVVCKGPAYHATKVGCAKNEGQDQCLRMLESQGRMNWSSWQVSYAKLRPLRKSVTLRPGWGACSSMCWRTQHPKISLTLLSSKNDPFFLTEKVNNLFFAVNGTETASQDDLLSSKFTSTSSYCFWANK